MCFRGNRQYYLVFLAISCFELGLALPAGAQAWLPPKGEGSYTLAYQNAFSRDHFDDSGGRFDDGHVISQDLIQSVEYSLTDKTALHLNIPFLAGVYHGDDPHLNAHHTDDGHYHGQFQDLRFGIRYNVRRHPFLVTPFIEGIVPSNGYEAFAHSAIGKHLRGVAVGTYLGRVLDPVLPRAYYQGQFSFTVVERVAGFRPVRSRLDGEFGYFVTRRVALQFLQSLQITHSGLNFPQDWFSPQGMYILSEERFINHDRIGKDSFLTLGGGFSLALSNSWTVFGSVVSTVWGHNGHALNHGIAIGMTRSFRTGRAVHGGPHGRGV